ncbi:MAG TPA: iron uptake transporter permease EfeU [Actinomycetota bacterium]|nr:iron uptake transporter permease EfeU [Actinomycetota bacterium]
MSPVGAAFLITLREGIEAALIISILLAYLRQLGRTDRSRLVWWGTGAAVLVSLAVGAVIFGVAGEFEGRAEEVFEGLVTLSAVGVLTWMIFWMRRQAARIKGELHERVDAALLGGGFALASLAFVVVLREGVETALFLFATARATARGAGGAAGQAWGAVLGLGTALVLGYLLYRGGIRLNLRTFFKVTGALILVVAAGLFAYSVHELQEAGWLPVLTATAFDASGILSDEGTVGSLLRAVFGYNADPTWLELAAWAAYLLVTGTLFFRPGARSAPAPGPVPAPDREHAPR